MRSFLKKIFLIAEAFFLKFKRKKDVLFIVSHKITFHYIRDMYECLEHDKRLRLRICFPYKHLLTAEEMHEWKEKYQFKIISYKVARFLKWDLIIFPDHGPYFRRECPKIYTGHGLYSGKEVKGESYVFGSRSLGEDKDIVYQKIFVTSDFVKNLIQKHHPKFHSRLKVTGSILLDRVKDLGDDREKVLGSLNFDLTRKTIMITSTWGSQCLAETQGLELLSKVENIAKKYNIIFTFHLLNFVDRFSVRKNWRELLGRINCKNVYVNIPGEEPYALLANVDLIVSDATSLGLYYPIFERPFIFYDNPNMKLEHVGLLKELCKTAYTIKDVSRLEDDIDKAFDGFDPLTMRELSKKISSFQGQARERYTEEIYEILNLG